MIKSKVLSYLNIGLSVHTTWIKQIVAIIRDLLNDQVPFGKLFSGIISVKCF